MAKTKSTRKAAVSVGTLAALKAWETRRKNAKAEAKAAKAKAAARAARKPAAAAQSEEAGA